MSEFGDVDLAVGSVTGFRRWRMTVDGQITGVAHRDAWVPGINTATCHAVVSQKDLPKRDDEEWGDYYARREEWKRNNHDYGECKCGFYAYFDGKGEAGLASNDPHISGYIEASGEVLIGTKGFRATQARALALCVPLIEGMWKLEPFFIDRLRANYPGVPIYESEFAMRADFKAPVYESRNLVPDVVPDTWAEA